MIPEINADQVLGFTELQRTIFNGKRSSTAQSYLSPARHRRNLNVIKHAYATRILINKNKEAYGVEFNYGKQKMKAYARKEVIVSAGALQSPPLLMRSGIGPKAHLQERNIRCKVDLPVGDNFIDHVFTFMVFQLDISPLLPTATLDARYQYPKDGTEDSSAVPVHDTTNSLTILQTFRHLIQS